MVKDPQPYECIYTIQKEPERFPANPFQHTVELSTSYYHYLHDLSSKGQHRRKLPSTFPEDAWSFLNVLNEAEPKEIVPVVGVIPEPVRRTQELRCAEPSTTAEHTLAALAPIRIEPGRSVYRRL